MSRVGRMRWRRTVRQEQEPGTLKVGSGLTSTTPSVPNGGKLCSRPEENDPLPLMTGICKQEREGHVEVPISYIFECSLQYLTDS